MPTSTSRLGLTQPVGTDTPSQLRVSITGNATALDNAAIFLSGTLASRPAASIAGRYYLATDDTDGGPQGTLFQDNGSTWVYPNQIAYSQGTAAARPSAGTQGRQYVATDTNQFSVDDGSIWIPQGFSYTTSGTPVPGQMVIANSITVTLPSPTTNATIGVHANAGVNGTSPVTISASSIFGLGVPDGTTSIKLGQPGTTIVFQAEGTARWRIVSGQQDTGWVSLSLNANWNPSGSYFTPAIRLIGDRVWLRGQVVNNTGVSSSGAIFNVTTSFAPASRVGISVNGTAQGALIVPLGNLTLFAAIANGATVGFDGSSYSIT